MTKHHNQRKTRQGNHNHEEYQDNQWIFDDKDDDYKNGDNEYDEGLESGRSGEMLVWSLIPYHITQAHTHTHTQAIRQHSKLDIASAGCGVLQTNNFAYA